MKKNLFSIIIIVLLAVNLVLTGVLAFSVIPSASKTNELVSKICSAVDLELESNDSTGVGSIPIDQIVVYDIADSMTINLKKGSDGKDHFAVLSVSLSMDSEHEDYKTYGEGELLKEKESLIKDKIRKVVSGYTMDEMKENPDKVLEKLLSEIQAMYDSEFIVQVSFRDAVYQ